MMAFIIQTINQKIQGIDNAYTIQGWLKGVNSNKLTSEADIGNDGKNDGIHNYIPGDQFGFSLGYFDGDYTPRAETDLASTDKFMLNHYFENSLYNGNITHMSSSIRHFMFDEEETDPQPSTFEYQYDQLNRILSSTHRNWLLETPTTTDTRWLSNYTYDLNGNIETLNRYDQNGTQFDQMNYNYGYTKDTDDWLNDDSEIDMEENNRLLSVDDLSLISIGVDITDQNPLNYSYDAIGNLVSDFKEEIEHIEWSVTGKIKRITRIENSQKDDLEFLYDPSGQRIAKIAKPRPTGSPSPENAWIITWYVRDASGNVMSTYDQSYSGNFAGPGENPCPASSYTSKFTIRWSEAHIYGSSRLGMEMEGIKVYESGAEMNPTTEEMEISGDNCIIIESNHVFSQELGDKRFELANHLGNVMVVVSDKRISEFSESTIASYTAEVMMATDYYPFGMVMSGRSFTSDAYRYGFNGKEQDKEGMGGGGSTYDYGFRIYNAGIAKFLSVDPHQVRYPEMSAYSIAFNNPLIYVDSDGRDNIIYLIVLPGAKNELAQNKTSAKEIARQANLNFCQLGVNLEVRVWDGKPEDFIFMDKDITDGIAIMGSGTTEVLSFMKSEIDPEACEDIFEHGICPMDSPWEGMDNIGMNDYGGTPERTENYPTDCHGTEKLHKGGEVIAIDTRLCWKTSQSLTNGTSPEHINSAFAILLNHAAGHLAGLGHSFDGGAYPHNTRSKIMTAEIHTDLKEVPDYVSEQNNIDYKAAVEIRFGTNEANEYNPNVKNYGEN